MTDNTTTIREAGFWRRALALLIDGIITLPIIGLMKLLGDVWLELAVVTVFYSAYVIVAFGSAWEATPGMKIMRVRIVNGEGGRLGHGGAARWIGSSLLVTLICMAPYLWFLSVITKHIPMEALVAAQRAGENPAILLEKVADLEGMPLATMAEYAVMTSMATLLLFIFWALTVVALPKKRGLHNLFAKTYMVKTTKEAVEAS